MKVFCSFCGANVDVEENDICPNCGADLSENEQLQQYRKLAEEQNRINLERNKMGLEQDKLRAEHLKHQIQTERKKHKTSSIVAIGCLIPVLFGLFAIAIMIFGGISAIKDDGEETIVTTEVYVEPHHDAELNEVVQTKYYQIVLDQWDYYEPNSYAIRDGQKYIKLHFKYTNTSAEKIYDDNDIYCYDESGKQCSTQASISEQLKNEKFDSQTVLPGKSYSGWLYYIVPESTNTLTVTYGESVEFTINISESSENS